MGKWWEGEHIKMKTYEEKFIETCKLLDDEDLKEVCKKEGLCEGVRKNG